MNHTPEPWRVYSNERNGSIGVHSVSAENDVAECTYFGLTSTKGSRAANAARIVACVNACAGIENPAAIADALNVLRDLAEHLLSAPDDFELELELGKLGMEALAKLKGGDA